jgi:hypothetical protein
MAVSMVLDPIQVSAQRKRVQDIVENIVGAPSTVHWRYSAYSNERFPLRAYSSALRGSGPDADEVLVVAVAWRNPGDGKGDRLVVGADTLDGDGVILAESPRFEVTIPDGTVALSESHQTPPGDADELRSAMQRVREWLDSQIRIIQEALAGGT